MTNGLAQTWAGDIGDTAQAYYVTNEGRAAFTVQAAREPTKQDKSALVLVGVTLAFGLLALMAWITAKGIVRKIRGKMVMGHYDDTQMEGFEDFRETWNDMAKKCIRVGEECAVLEKVISQEKREVTRDLNESVVKAVSKGKPKSKASKATKTKADEGDPCMPDNQEWGEW